MAFVQSRITKEEGEMLNHYIPRSPFYNDLPSYYMQVYDKERDIRLLSLGGEGFLNSSELPKIFAFIWKGLLCTIEAFHESDCNAEGRAKNIRWTFKRIHAPKQLESKEEEFLALLKEAFEVYKKGSIELSKYIEHVSFTSIAKPMFMGERGWSYGELSK